MWISEEIRDFGVDSTLRVDSSAEIDYSESRNQLFLCRLPTPIIELLTHKKSTTRCVAILEQTSI